MVMNNRCFIIEDLMIQNIEGNMRQLPVENDIYYIAKTPMHAAKKIAAILHNDLDVSPREFLFSIREITANSKYAKNYYYLHHKLIRIKKDTLI